LRLPSSGSAPLIVIPSFACKEKLRVEQLQRDNRHKLESEGKLHKPRFFAYRRIPFEVPQHL
jgi:hypothetical protein